MRQLLVPLQAEAGIFSGTCLASDSGMAGAEEICPETTASVRSARELLAYGPIGKETSGARYKQYGYGAPVRLTFRQGGKTRRGGVGHDESRSIRP